MNGLASELKDPKKDCLEMAEDVKVTEAKVHFSFIQVSLS